MARLRRRSALAASLSAASLAVLLSSCGSSGALNNAKASCRKVSRSITLYEKSLTAPPAQAAALRNQAGSELQLAAGAAALATSADGSFNALMTTISESTRVPENLLIPALRSQCKVINSSTPYLSS